MNIQENISLKPYNTFQIDKKARFFVEVNSAEEIKEALTLAKDQRLPVFILGGGSNILLTKDIFALVIKINIKGIEVIQEDEHHVWAKVGAGEIWHDFVNHAIRLQWAGVENLSLIPGTVGASPMQNIGAYGVEIKEVFDHLEAIHRKTLTSTTFDKDQCHFGYRESIFKNVVKDQYIITHVIYKLSKKPTFNISYGAIRSTLDSMGIGDDYSIKDISDAVIQIRQEKLPDPALLGNAGSFFKNPVLSKDHFNALKKQFPEIPHYPHAAGIKVPAAWLIEKSGWKGRTFGNIGVHKNQPLVLVNYGNGEGEAIKALSERIQKDIKERFGVVLSPEVNFI
ncbi:UDP-N-acetylenolpyruvoylglucosamine reductase [Echinicola strongylocentroti]|uniref:UDP-N-acetylenolpyruvoylglucosamine reductase n=1 Tax=Echinicola strongylocentroti TaxID=1795355 RepID=A0A2Z4IQF5_9BACT|nr:UDP-N-acetylmuramate dehydrogenase [Echinicola strongylocentroti]AWW32533.1 UDP-N-acetylenolpyruvoylglucosamine reductase [Echinicola strongylocentroti]